MVYIFDSLAILTLSHHNSATQQELLNLLGSMYAAVLFLGASNSMTVQPVVGVERTVMYREKAAGMYSALAYAIGQVKCT